MSDNAVSQGKAYPEFIPEVWGKKLTAVLNKSGVMMKCVNRDYEGDIKAAGDTVHIRTFGDVSVNSYTGSSITYNDLTATSQELILDQQQMFAFKVPDISSAQSDVEIMKGYIERAKVAVDLVKDSFLLGKHADVPAGNVIGTDPDPVIITKDNIYSQFVELGKTLKESNALSTGKMPWVVINPEIEALLIQAPEFTHASVAGDAALREGSIGKIAGLDVLVSTNLTGVTLDTTNFDGERFYVMAGTNDAITFASQVVKVEKLRAIDTFSDLVRGLYVYGAKTVVPNAMAKLICTTTSY